MATEGAGAGAGAGAGPRYLILGGLGFIGRHLLEHLIEGGIAGSVRVVDKRVPITAFLSAKHKALLKNDKVDFVQADLAEDEHVGAAFDITKGTFDVVVCLAAETGYGQAAERYAVTEAIASKCGAAALASSIPKFIYVSTATVYKSQKTPNTETASIDPWTTPATHQRKAEETLQAMAGLPLVILRPAITYGPYDVSGLMPRAVCAASYTRLGEKMKFLWDSSMRLNTVHVRDVVRAIVHTAGLETTSAIFNVVDKGGTDQGKVSAILGELFGIETGFHGKIVSNLARVRMEVVVEDANDTHMAPWIELCREHSIEHTPLSPFLSIELLRQNQLSVDGRALEATGFRLSHPELTKDLISEAVATAIAESRFPPVAPGVPGGVPTSAAGAGAGAGAGASA